MVLKNQQMHQLEKITEFYLNSKTSYALLITGEWGIGKTYYFQNTLKERLGRIQCDYDPSKNYKPILISLFGKKSIEEVQSEIFLSFYPLFKKKAIKLTLSTCKSLARGIMNVTKVGDLKDYVSDFNIKAKDYIDFREIVLCFDDLERKSKNLKLEEIVGFINDLVENNGVKVIIIANESKINNFSDLKEKIVGNTIEFIPDIQKNYDSLANRQFEGCLEFVDFLDEHKKYILENYPLENVRILSFIFTYLREIYLGFKEELKSHKAIQEISHEAIKSIIKFTICIGTEYKLGNISFKDRKSLDNNPIVWSILTSLDNYKPPEGKEKNFVEIFIENYYKDQRFYFFSSIYNFLTGGAFFDVKELINELKSLYGIKDDKIPPQYELYNSLIFPNVFSLSEVEYVTKTK